MGGKFIYHKLAESQHALSITIPYEHIDALEGILARSRYRTEHRKTDEVQGSPLLKGADSSIAGADRVLIVGDHAGQNRLLQEQLASLNRVITIAKNGAEAMLYLQNQQDISLVICDVLLSDVSGIELTMNIRTQYDIGLLPVILIIDSNQAGIAASAFSAGANDLIRRPFEKAEVIARVRNLLLQREASLARENYRALNRELEIARSIQESIIPTSQPRSGNYKIEAVCMPARSIGGDFYDFVEDENTVGVLIADVAGHGIPAALYAAMLKIAFHNLRDRAHFPEKLLKDLNDMMVDRGERTFISCAYTLVDFKNKRLLHANAGHLPLLVQEPGKKTVKHIQPPGGVLGVRKAAAVTVEMQHLQPQTRLVLFTDGVIEMTNKQGKFFDEERLVQVLEEMRDEPLAAVKERLLATLREFAEGEPFLDDVTFVLLDV
jgi:two-component system sensor histidine kinase ChiS